MAQHTVRLSPDPPGAAIARFLIALKQGQGDYASALHFAEPHCKSTPQVLSELAYRRDHLGLAKSAVDAGTLGGTHWLDDVVPYGLGGELFTNLESSGGIYARFAGLFRPTTFRTRTPVEAGAGAAASWKGEALPVPVKASATNSITIEPFTASIVMAISDEALRFGVAAERAITRLVVKAVNKFIDQQLLDPTITASSARPASLTNLGTPVSSTGSSAAQIVADLASLIAAVGTPLDTARWVMQPKTLYTIYARLAGAGCPQPAGQLLGIPVFSSSTCPAIVALIDAESIINATDRTVVVDLSRHAGLEMLDSALQQDGSTGAGTALVGLWQSGLVAIKAELLASWMPAMMNVGSPQQAAGVSYMSVNY